MRSLILITALLLAQAGQAELLNVQQLNQKIQKSGGAWVARKNHLTSLSRQEARHRMGLRDEEALDVQFMTPDAEVVGNLPPQLDWRDKAGQNWVSPILDQGNCGSCVAFAAVGVLETQYKISSLFPNFNVKFSPQHLFACGGGACNYGWTPGGAAGFLQRSGIPDEACMPYISGATGQDVACRATCADASQRTFRISSYSTPTRGSHNVEAVKRALQQGPLVTTLTVYADFMAYAGGVYKHTSGEYEGGHAISIVGYDDTKNAFIIRNSWGQGWGENGFAYVDYDDQSGVGDSTWLYNIPTLTGAVSAESPADYSYFTGTASVKGFSSFPSTDSIAVGIYNSQNQAVASMTCAGASCAQNLDVSSLADGRYEVQFIALDNHGGKIGVSERHFFYVANQQPQLSLSFTGKGVDLSQDLSGRIEMDVTASSSSVPLSSIIFHHRGPDGKEDTRSSSVVPEKLSMGWRTNLGPNGQYEIWFVGHVQTNGMDVQVESAHKMVSVNN